jgi:hypothetical protein
MTRIKLTAENYFSDEANWQYMSASQFKAFKRCEAAAMAELRGEWGRKDSTALLVGSYVDAYFSGELEQFCNEHPEIYKRDGTLKADFQKAHDIAMRLESDDLARMLLCGKNQVIKTGKIAGVWFKAKFDSLLTARQVEAICKQFPNVRDIVPFGGGMIVDLKVMKDFEPLWDDDEADKVSFVNFWGYDIQGAIYQKIDGRNCPFVIVAATKEDEPNIDAMQIPDTDLEFCLADVEMLAPRFDAIKRGEIAPAGCGHCAYCRSVKRLHDIKHYKLINE